MIARSAAIKAAAGVERKREIESRVPKKMGQKNFPDGWRQWKEVRAPGKSEESRRWMGINQGGWERVWWGFEKNAWWRGGGVPGESIDCARKELRLFFVVDAFKSFWRTVNSDSKCRMPTLVTEPLKAAFSLCPANVFRIVSFKGPDSCVFIQRL